MELPVSRLASRHKLLRIVATLAALAALGGCGYKGPLYLPGDATQGRQPADSPQAPPPVPTPIR